jgi:hypothetical protein
MYIKHYSINLMVRNYLGNLCEDWGTILKKERKI